MNPSIESFLMFADRAGLELLVWSWQALVLLVCIWSGLRLFRVRMPTLRQQIWLISLLAVLSLPLWPLVLPKSSLPQERTWKSPTLSYAAELPRLVIVPTVRVEATSLRQEAARPVLRRQWVVGVLPGVFCIWMVGAFIALFRSVRAYLRLRRASRHACPTTLEELGIALRFPQSVSLSLSASVRSPVLLGLRHLMILLPHDLVEWTSAEEREAMIAHELAHLARFDHFTNLLPNALNALFFFHPLVRYACRQFCLEREMACDDRVIGNGADATIYAESLVKAAERSLKGKLDDLASYSFHQPAFFTTKQALERRIEMILNTDRVRVLARGWRYLILAGLLIFALAGLLVPDRPATAQQVQKKIDDATASIKGEGLKGLLGKYMVDTAAYDKMVDTVLSDSDERLREGALQQLVQSQQSWATAALEEIYDATSDTDLRSKVIGYLGQRRDSSKLLDLAIKEPSAGLRQQAVQRLLELDGDDKDGVLIDLYARRLEKEIRESILRRLAQMGDIRGLAIVGDIEKHGTNDPALNQLNWQQLEWVAGSHESPETRRRAQEWLAMRRRQAPGKNQNGQVDEPPPPPPPPKPAPKSLNDSAALVKMLQQQPNDDNVVLALLRETNDAALRHDTEFFNNVLADDYQGIGFKGEVINKAQVIAQVKLPFINEDTRHEVNISKIDLDDLRLMGEGNSMVATYISTIYFEEDGKKGMIQIRNTDNFIKRRGAWQFVRSHATLVK